jgi:integrase
MRQRSDGKPNRQKRTVKLTDLFIKNLKPDVERFQVYDTQQPGLVLRVEATGSKSFWCVYRFGAKPRWIKIGDVHVIDLGDGIDIETGKPVKGARSRAKRILCDAVDGKDAVAEAKAERNTGTFEELADAYLSGYAKKNNRSWEYTRKKLVERFYFPKWRQLPAHSITSDEVRKIVTAIESDAIRNLALAAGSAIYTWAIDPKVAWGGLRDNPFKLFGATKIEARKRTVKDHEMPLLWQEFGKEGLNGTMLKVLLLCGQRSCEVQHMRIEDIHGDWWHLPGAHSGVWCGTKNKKDHRIYLTPELRDLLPKINGKTGYVFSDAGRKAKLDDTMRSICKRLGITIEQKNGQGQRSE